MSCVHFHYHYKSPFLFDAHSVGAGVAYAEPDWLIEGQGQPNDPEFHEQWGLVSANADCAWHKMADITTSSVPVCVVDSGKYLSFLSRPPRRLATHSYETSIVYISYRH